MTPYLIVFLAGLAGSMHCIGMCGGFACGLGAERARPGRQPDAPPALQPRPRRELFLGGMVGHVGLLLVDLGVRSHWGIVAQRALALLSGALMVFVGLQFLGLLRHRRLQRVGAGADVLVQALRRLVAAPGPAAPLALGVLNGFLPCPLVYAFVAQTAGCGSAMNGLQLMATFGLGTFPAMLAMGGLGWWRRSHTSGAPSAGVAFLPRRPVHALSLRLQGVRLAGGFIVLLGLVTLARGVLPVAAHSHGF
jgi:uncharacterized protein